jgi:hypothetical protein
MKPAATVLGLMFGVLGALVIGGLQVAAIGRSTSSTAPIGYIFVPILMLAAFAVFFVFGYGIGYVRDQLSQGRKKSDLRVLLPSTVVILIGGYFLKEAVTGIFVMKTVAEVEQADSAEKLNSILEQSVWGKNKFVLGVIAQKRIASPELLDRIAHLSDPELQEAMGSFLPVMGKNGKGLAVMRLLVDNPNVTPQTIEFLAVSSHEKYVLGDIAANSKTSLATLEKLAQEKNYLVDWGLAQNPNTPPHIFALLLDRNKDSSQKVTLDLIQRNPAAPSDVQAKAQEILKTWK